MKMRLHLSYSRRLEIVIFIACSICIAEIVGTYKAISSSIASGIATEVYSLFLVGRLTKTLVLIADAFHMISDLLGYAILYTSIRLSTRTNCKPPATVDHNCVRNVRWYERLSYGWGRSDVVGAFFNGAFLIAIGLGISLQATERFVDRRAIDNPDVVIVMGCVGLVANCIMAVVFGHHGHGDKPSAEKIQPKSSLDTLPTPITSEPSKNKTCHGSLAAKGVLIHILGDALNTIGVVLVGFISHFFPGDERVSYADAVISMIIGGSIMATALPLTLRSGLVLLQTCPANIPQDQVRADLLALPSVRAVEDLRIWQLDASHKVATVSISVQPLFIKDVSGEQEVITFAPMGPSFSASTSSSTLPVGQTHQSHVWDYTRQVAPSTNALIRQAHACLGAWGIQDVTVQVKVADDFTGDERGANTANTALPSTQTSTRTA